MLSERNEMGHLSTVFRIDSLHLRLTVWIFFSSDLDEEIFQLVLEPNLFVLTPNDSYIGYPFPFHHV